MSEFFSDEVMEQVRCTLDNEPPTEEKEKPSETKDDILKKRLETLTEKHTKSLENEKNAANRTKLLSEQIKKVRMELHGEEISRMDKFCEESSLTYDEIISIVKNNYLTSAAKDIIINKN